MAGDLERLHSLLLVLAAWSDEHGHPPDGRCLRWLAVQAVNVADEDTWRLVDDARHRAERGLE